MSMTNYMISGQDLLDFDSEITTDSKGKKIIASLNYIITTLVVEEREMTIIRTEEDYIQDKKILKSMVYTKKGFAFLIDTLETAEIISIKDQIEEINNIINTFASLEDFESASALKNDLDKYKEINKDE